VESRNLYFVTGCATYAIKVAHTRARHRDKRKPNALAVMLLLSCGLHNCLRIRLALFTMASARVRNEKRYLTCKKNVQSKLPTHSACASQDEERVCAQPLSHRSSTLLQLSQDERSNDV
jgi:hypothetical protein